MTLITAFSSRLHRLDEMLRRWIGRPALVMLISVSPYLIPGIATRMVLPRNRALGITLVVLSLVLAGVVLRQLRIRLRKPGPPIYIVAMLSTLLFLGVGSFAAISAAIFTSDPLAYKVITPRLLFDVSPGIGSSGLVDPFGFFADYYLYVFLDLLPAVEATETLKLISPAEPATTVAGIPVLAFRIYVLLALIASVKTWYKSTPRREIESSAH